jgi:hypothetical protein
MQFHRTKWLYKPQDHILQDVFFNDILLSLWFTVDGNLILGLLTLVDVGDIASVSEACVASAFRECGESL